MPFLLPLLPVVFAEDCLAVVWRIWTAPVPGFAAAVAVISSRSPPLLRPYLERLPRHSLVSSSTADRVTHILSAARSVADRARGFLVVSRFDGLTAFLVRILTRGASSEGNGGHGLLSLARRKAPFAARPSRLW